MHPLGQALALHHGFELERQRLVVAKDQYGFATGRVCAGQVFGGAAIGGLLGNQVGSGKGKTAATAIGAGAGAAVGTQVGACQ